MHVDVLRALPGAGEARRANCRRHRAGRRRRRAPDQLELVGWTRLEKAAKPGPLLNIAIAHTAIIPPRARLACRPPRTTK